ncbi:DUF4012 domain-containing protein [Pseudarthrobacter sp. NPDC058329]|uniref:DUF4012 domain-containing protein n=1 Tax=Pseudarthrobacter sp. NPDC058329 TaxID=3346448 RepID=UPI0036DF364A
MLLVLTGWTGWLVAKASAIRSEISAAISLITQMKSELAASDEKSAQRTAREVRSHTAAAREAADDPLWTLTSNLPFIGANIGAVSEVARSADDVAGLSLVPLMDVWGSLHWDTVLPTRSGSDLAPLKAASPTVKSAAYAVRVSTERLSAIDKSRLLPQVAKPLADATEQLQEITGALNVAAAASTIAPGMLGADGARNYLLIVQNNAESRSSGGIPGALAVLNLDAGKLTLGAQNSASGLGVMSPVIPVDPQQKQIYSGRLGKFIQDVNLTPDFPTAAATAQAMWEQRMGQRVDGVISIDPVALSYILDATGPVTVNSPELAVLPISGLPTELNAGNVVSTLLSDVYSQVEQPELQDAYFAAVAKQVFDALGNGKSEPTALMDGLSRATEEGRILVWSRNENEQAVLGQYALSGAIAGPSVLPAQFGVYFNDGTGAKMDYYVKRTVQLIKECPRDGYEQTTVRVTSTNTVRHDAADVLPTYVTGDGSFNVPPGSVQTNIVAYGPSQAYVETAKVDGQGTEFAPYLHGNRPVGVYAVRLAPGESKTVEFTFGKIVQHTEPYVFVTPTVQPVDDVKLPTLTASCG